MAFMWHKTHTYSCQPRYIFIRKISVERNARIDCIYISIQIRQRLQMAVRLKYVIIFIILPSV